MTHAIVVAVDGARLVSAEDSPAFNALVGRVTALETGATSLAARVTTTESGLTTLTARVTATEASLTSILTYNYVADFEAGLL